MPIVKRCGLPKGITKKSLHKAYIIRQLEKGVSPADLQKRFSYKSYVKWTATILILADHIAYLLKDSIDDNTYFVGQKSEEEEKWN